MPIAGEVAIIGSAATRFGVLHDRGYLELLAEAARGAIADAGIDQDDLEAAWLGTAEPLTAALLGDAGTAVTEAIDFAPRPVTRVSTFCCTGMEAVRAAAMAIAAGEHELVLAVGAEKMRDVPPRGSLVARTANLTHPTLAKGRTAPGQFALLANRYLHDYDCTVEDLAGVAVKNHANAAHNPIAQYSDPLTVEQVLKSTSRGGASGVTRLHPDDRRRSRRGPDLGGARSGARAALRGDRGNRVGGGRRLLRRLLPRPQRLCELPGDARGGGCRIPAGRYHRAPRTTGRGRVPRLFTITELINYEDLGLCERGEGAGLLRAGVTSSGGEIPVNLSGGLQACGHPVGATGVRMIKEITDQVLGRAGARQQPGVRRGAAHTLGGPGVASCVAVIGAA